MLYTLKLDGMAKMEYKILLNIIKSDIDHLERHKFYDKWTKEGKLDYDNNPNAYFEYVKFVADPAIKWCYDNKITKFNVKPGEYAMQLYFIFNKIEDAVAFKLKWIK